MKNIFKKSLVGLLVLAQIQVIGCSTILGAKETYGKYSAEKNNAVDISINKQNKNLLVNHLSGVYVDTTPVKVSDQKAKLLEIFPQNIAISSHSLMSAREIADRVMKLTRIPINYRETGQATQVTAASPSQSPTQGPGAINKSLLDIGIQEPLPTALGTGLGIDDLYGSLNTGTLGFPSNIPSIDAAFDGKLTDFLDLVTGRMGLSWKFDSQEKRIVFYRLDTKTFFVHVMPGDIQLDATLTNTTSASSTDTNSKSMSMAGQSTKLNTTINVWTHTLKVVEKMLSKGASSGSSGGQYEGNEALGTITITDTPIVLAEIERYVEQINKTMSRQVAFDVLIYDITITKDNTVGIDWNFVWDQASKFGAGFSAASVAASTLKTGANFVAHTGNPAGSTALVKALETQGNVSLKTHQQTMTLNNTPVPVKVADETTYLASASSGSVGGVSSAGTLTTTLVPGKVVSGLTMTLLPRVFDANQMMLQMSVDITQLKSMSTITSGSSSIQAPVIGTKSFIQRVAVKNNETLIMSGFDQDSNSINSDSSLDIPGGLGLNEKHVITVIMITPRITEGVSTQ